MPRRPGPIGVLLAGGLGSRIGGSKAMVELHGKPLICYPLEAMQEALGAVAIAAKPDSELPSLPGVSIWIEPPTPQHPLVGILHALSAADGRAVLICASDLPFVTAKAIRRIAGARAGSAPAVIAYAGGRVQPLLGCYQPQALALLQRIDIAAAPPLRDVVMGIGAKLIDVGDPELIFNVNAPEDLLHAAGILDSRRPRPTRR